MVAESITLEKLYENYGKLTKEEICKLLEKIKIVWRGEKNDSSVSRNYYLSRKIMSKIKENPYTTTLFLDIELDKENNVGKRAYFLRKWKIKDFLVKSGSNFIFNPSVNEIFYQMTEDEKKSAKAVMLVPNSCVNIEGTQCTESIAEFVIFK